jgi:uncharacterized protein
MDSTVDVLRGVRVPTNEPGATLAADVFLPRAEGPVPAIVSMLPYRRDAVGGASMWDTLHAFAAHGYACVLVEPEGLGSSDGSARPPFDPNEADDGVAAVTWAAQQPWCTGNVGMWGFSYGALLALRTAARGVSGLRAVVSVMALLDPERDFAHPGGVAGCLTAQGMWGLSTLVDLLLPPVGAHHDGAEQRRWRDRTDHAEPYLVDLYRHPPGHPAWRARALDPTSIDIPVLCVGGLRDMFCDATLRLYEGTRGPSKLILGPWSHNVPHEASVRPIDLPAMAIRWWDRWLRDEPNGIETEPPVTVFVHSGVQSGEWIDLERWPAAPLVAERIGSDGGPWPSDPTVGAAGGLWGIPSGAGQPLDQHDDDMRSLTFTGPPVDEPVRLIGTASVAVPGTEGRLVVKLADVDPNGRSSLIAGGIRADGAGEVRLDPTAYEVPAGHRLRVVVSDAAFPRLWPAVAAGVADAPEAVTVRLPVVEVGVGKPAAPPEAGPADPSGVWLHHTPRREIRSEPRVERVTVVLGDTYGVRVPGTAAVIEADTRLDATVQSGGSSRVRGEATLTARLSSGEAILVEVKLRLTPAGAEARGRVDIDGTTVVERDWHQLSTYGE